ncbi:MAG: SWIM zinc finger family protein [Actinomycetia bacterium]|nr:SWIM zinc finger family protein [Actinomycetes bacterium]
MSDWGYREYYPPSRPRKVKDGIKSESRRGKIGDTWWSSRWIEVLESFNMGARFNRGKSYARSGQVIKIEIEPGEVEARVQGSRARPYTVLMKLKPLPEHDWDKVTDAMASQAIFAAKLLAGEMPANIEDAFDEAKVPLFPGKRGDLVTDCSCPDWANPCKHIAAVYFLLAEEFDRDPFMIFKLRGRTRDQIVEALRGKRIAAPQDEEGARAPKDAAVEEEPFPPLEECTGGFWSCGGDIEGFSACPKPPEVEFAVLKRLGPSPFAAGSRDFTELLEPVYELVSRRAMELGLGE